MPYGPGIVILDIMKDIFFRTITNITFHFVLKLLSFCPQFLSYSQQTEAICTHKMEEKIFSIIIPIMKREGEGGSTNTVIVIGVV